MDTILNVITAIFGILCLAALLYSRTRNFALSSTDIAEIADAYSAELGTLDLNANVPDASFYLGAMQKTDAQVLTPDEWTAFIQHLESQSLPHPFDENGKYLGIDPTKLFGVAITKAIDLSDPKDTLNLVKDHFNFAGD